MKIKYRNLFLFKNKLLLFFRMSRANRAKLLLRGLIVFLFSLIFVFFPWTEFVGANPDTFFYLERIRSLLIGNESGLEGLSLFQWIFSEPVWRSILIFIGNWLYDPLNGLRLISFFCIFTFTLFLFRRIKNYFLVIFFLLNPMLVDLVMFQTRSALAMSLCLIAFMVKSRSLGVILIIIAILTHSVVLIILVAYLYARFLERNQNKFNHKLFGGIAFSFAIALSILLSHGRQAILERVGDRRVIYDAGTGSFLYLSFWILLAFVLLFTRRRNGSTECWGDYYSIVMLSLPFLMKFFDVNGVRFVPLSFPFIILAIFRRVTPIRELLIGSLFVYQLVQYAYWLRII